MIKINKQDEIDAVLEKAAKFANNNRDFIMSITSSSLYNDEPKLFAYSAMYKLHRKQEYEFDYSSGVSFDKKIALMRVLGEGLERYCLDNFEAPIIKVASSNMLQEAYLNPIRVSPFSSKQLKNKKFNKFIFTDETQFKFTKGFSLTQSKNILIPAQLVSFNFNFDSEQSIISPISTGAAAGTGLNDAIYRAVCEVVERDSFMINYLNMLPSPRVSLNLIKDKRLKKILAIFTRYELELVVFDLTTDLTIPSYAALTLDRTGLGPAVSVGLKAGFNRLDSIIGAIEESLMTRSWIRDKFLYLEPNHKNEDTIKNIEDRAYLWFSIKMIEKLNFWLKNNKRVNIDEKEQDSFNKLEKIMKIFNEKNIELIYVDITNDKMRQYGFTVVKVIIPELQPLYLNDHYPYLGGKRLYTTPVVMGYIPYAKKEEEFNTFPHPFL